MTLPQEVLDRAKAGSARIERVEHAGKVYWIKRPERLSLKMRLQKGNPAEAFAAEVAAHERFSQLGLPVPEMLGRGDGYLITADAGPTLLHVLNTGGEFLAALDAAGRALAGFHAAGFSHGRPSLKDICWQDDRIVFLDFERAAARRNGQGGRAMDLLIFLFSTTVETRGSEAAQTTARNGYLATGDTNVWTRARSRLRRLTILRYLLWPVARLLKGNKEFDAIEPFFRFVLAARG